MYNLNQYLSCGCSKLKSCPNLNIESESWTKLNKLLDLIDEFPSTLIICMHQVSQKLWLMSLIIWLENPFMFGPAYNTGIDKER